MRKIKKIIFVSPKKSGTHLILSILKNLQYDFKGKLDLCSTKTGFYSLGNTFHTSYNNFFYYLDRESFDGGKLLPINNCLGLVTCRHPLDILYSHLNFSYKNNNTAYSNIPKYNFSELIKIFFENDVYENFFKTLYEFTYWSRMNNFLTVSYESLIDFYKSDKKEIFSLNKLSELTGQTELKELILKSYGNSDTFYKGRVGEGLKFIKKYNKSILTNVYYKKYCEFYGYNNQEVTTPKSLDKLNKKEYRLFDHRKKNHAYTVCFNFFKHTVIFYNNRLYAVPDEQNIDFMKYTRFRKFFFEI